MDEREVAKKLLTELHLSVAERRPLPQGRARLSVVAAMVADELARVGWFPRELRAGQDIGDGAILEFRAGAIWVHEQHEIGVSRFGPVRSFQVPDVRSAVLEYLRALGGSPIDGVDIDLLS